MLPCWQGRKHFFFEKKKQKTFASLEPSHCDSAMNFARVSWRSYEQKFLGSLFKKALLLAFFRITSARAFCPLFPVP
jgi:hypothetical protein